MDNWGTPSDLLYEKGPSVQTLEGLLKGEYEFFTRCRPPIGIYEKMAADGLVLETEWRSDADDEWAVGKGLVVKGDQVPRGIFRYNIDAVTEPLLKEKTDDDLPF